MFQYLGEECMGRITFLASRANEQGFVLSDKLLESFYWTDVFDQVFTSMWGHRYANEAKNIVLYLHYLISGLIASKSIAIPVLQNYSPIPRDQLQTKSLFEDVADIRSIFNDSKPVIPSFLLTERPASGNFKVLECSDILLKVFTEMSHLPWENTVYGKYFENQQTVQSITESIRRFARVEPSADFDKFLLLHDGKEINVCPFTFVDAGLSGPAKIDTRSQLTPIRLQLIDRQLQFTVQEIEQFERMLNDEKATERDWQRFFEANPKFLLGYEYRHLHPQVILVADSSTSRIVIPDFFLERNGTGFIDIFELKGPEAPVLVGPKGRARFSSGVHAALSQLREYEKIFRSAELRRQFHKRFGFEGYTPKICVIIGRSNSYYTELERDDVEDEYTRLNVLTYDDVLLRAKNFQYF